MQNEKMANWVTTQAHDTQANYIKFKLGGILPTGFDTALLRVIGSDINRVWLNNRPVGITDDWQGTNWNVTGIATAGENTVTVEVRTHSKEFNNCWLYLDKQLPEAQPVDQLDFNVLGATKNEWIYVQFIDASGRYSGYTCLETGRTDLMLGTTGAPRSIVVRPQIEKQLQPNSSFDWQKVAKIRLRIDQKEALSNPKGSMVLWGFQLNNGSLSTSGWSVSQGQGQVVSELNITQKDELNLQYDFTNHPEASLLCELAAADSNGQKIAQIITDDKTTSDQGPVKLAVPSLANEWLTYLPCVIRDCQDLGIKPVRQYTTLNTSDGKELYTANQTVTIQLDHYDFNGGSTPPSTLILEEWNRGKLGKYPIKWDGRNTEHRHAAVTLPKLPKGLYRVLVPYLEAKSTVAAFAVVAPGEKGLSKLLPTLKPYTHRKQMLGVNDNAFAVQHSGSLWSLRDMDINLLVAHMGPSDTENGTSDDLIAYCKTTGTHFTINVETPNFWSKSDSSNGKNTFDAAGGCHRWDVDADTLRKAAATGVFCGVTYDESEHMQISRNGYSQLPEPNRKPFFVETNGMSLHQAYATLKDALRKLVKRNASCGTKMLAESVFPVLWHPMAESGMLLSPKLLKEDVHPVVFAEALGAAIQHHTELWFSPDLWYYGEMPGHSVRQMQMAMRSCYLAGVDTCYVEHATKMYSLNGASYKLTPHGDAMRQHITKWIPAQKRDYTYYDYQPEVAIVRFPDSDWGQASCSYWDYLYGAMNLHSSAETREHMQIWSLLTDGALNGRSVNFNGEPLGAPHTPQVWRFTFNSPAVAVFDHNVAMKYIQNVKVIFACGTELSDQTREALKRCVNAGAVCFISSHLASDELRSQLKGLSVKVAEGKGSWVIMSNYSDEAIAPYRSLLPKSNGAMWLKFKGHRVKLPQ